MGAKTNSLFLYVDDIFEWELGIIPSFICGDITTGNSLPPTQQVVLPPAHRAAPVMITPVVYTYRQHAAHCAGGNKFSAGASGTCASGIVSLGALTTLAGGKPS